MIICFSGGFALVIKGYLIVLIWWFIFIFWVEIALFDIGLWTWLIVCFITVFAAGLFVAEVIEGWRTGLFVVNGGVLLFRIGF